MVAAHERAIAERARDSTHENSIRDACRCRAGRSCHPVRRVLVIVVGRQGQERVPDPNPQRQQEIAHLARQDSRRLGQKRRKAAACATSHSRAVTGPCGERGRRAGAGDRGRALREAQAAVSIRSEDDIDYTTFGQLGDIIRENWSDFAGMLSNQSAVSRVLSALNMLRGTIAHCGVLAEDEVDRLKLAIRDWFRVLEGPKG